MATQAEGINARSWLFAPGDSERKMEKATAGAADIVLLDLEDAVAEGEKPKARSMVTAFLKAHAQQRAAALGADQSDPGSARAGRSRGGDAGPSRRHHAAQSRAAAPMSSCWTII